MPYPFLASLFPPLALAARNASELGSLGVLGRPLLISLGVAAFGYAIGALLRLDRHRSALLGFGVVVIFSAYGYIGQALRTTEHLAALADPVRALPLSALTLLVLILLLVRLRRDLRPMSRLLNTATAIALVAPLVTLATAVDLSAGPRYATSSRSAGLYDSTDHRPSVYLLVVDQYTGSESLLANWGFDNSPFERALHRRGFEVVPSGRANYPFTFLSLAALLNWRYLDELRPTSDVDPDWKSAFTLVENSRAQEFFRKRGYRFIFFPTPFAGTARNRNADLQLPDPRQVGSEFEAVWAGTTMAGDLLAAACTVLPCRGDPGYVPESARLLDWKFEQLADLPTKVHPAFVFIHLMIPHEPYVYDADCRHRRSNWPQTSREYDNPLIRAGYVAQLQCVNRKILAVVDTIMRRSRVPPVILLQSDHGHGRFGTDLPVLEESDPVRVAERMETFGAYYFPGSTASLSYPDLSPVNVFRLVLPRYFGVELPLLPDQSYWASSAHVFRFESLDTVNQARRRVP